MLLLDLALAPVRVPLAVARALAMARVDAIDADVARRYVDDGRLSGRPPFGDDDWTRELRHRRLAAVELLNWLGGTDPHGTFTHPMTPEQLAAYQVRHRHCSHA